MGCYDDVIVPCPKCGEREYFQSKSGDCLMRTFELHEAPADVLSDVNRHAPYRCQKCGVVFEVKVQATAIAVVSGSDYAKYEKTGETK